MSWRDALAAPEPPDLLQGALGRLLGPRSRLEASWELERDLYVLRVWPEPRGWRPAGTATGQPAWCVEMAAAGLLNNPAGADATALLEDARRRLLSMRLLIPALPTVAGRLADLVLDLAAWLGISTREARHLVRRCLG